MHLLEHAGRGSFIRWDQDTLDLLRNHFLDSFGQLVGDGLSDGGRNTGGGQGFDRVLF